MPKTIKLWWEAFQILIIGILIFSFTQATWAYEGFNVYYVRYDVKSSANQIKKDQLTMIPAKNDFRGENFSLIEKSGYIHIKQADQQKSLEDRVKEDFLKNVLVSTGLKSVKTKDLDTVISYEGIVITPVKILKTQYIQKKNHYAYQAQAQFCPLAFPDRWNMLGIKRKLKNALFDFLQFFN